MELKVDWTGLGGELQAEVLGALRGLVDGAEEDLREFGAAIARDLVLAIRDGDHELLGELGHQVQVLGEIHRIRLVNASWDQVGKIVALVGRVAMKAIAAAAAV